MYVSLKEQSNKWDEYTVLLPCVAVGNVGQLTLDLIIFNLKANLCGYMHSSSLLPVTGSNPYNPSSPHLATSCEVYECPKEKLVMLQIRSLIAPLQKDNYVTDLTDWIKEMKFAKVILLTSCFSQFSTQQDLNVNAFQYLQSPGMHDTTLLSQLETELFVKPLKRRDPYTQQESPTGEFILPGSGVTKQIYNSCLDKEIPFIALIKFCSEGDNYPDAYVFADLLSKYLTLKQNSDTEQHTQKWSIPVSWSLPFGNAAPVTIY